MRPIYYFGGGNMSVYYYCTGCKSSYSLDLKKCPKCGTAVPRVDKSFRVSVMVKGRHVNKIIPGSLTQAREIAAQIKADLVSGIYYDKRKSEQTLDEIWEKYLSAYKSHGKAWRAEERRYNQYLKPKLGKKVLSDISPFDIESIRVTLAKSETKYGTPYAPKTIKNIIDLLSILFNYAIDMDLFDGRNPCDKVKRPRINNEVTNILTVEKLKAFLIYLEKYEHRPTANLLKFLLFTGIRLGEAFKLTFADIDFADKTMVLRDPKGGKDQTLYLNDLAVSTLRDQQNYMHHASNLVFPNQQGRIRTEIGERWATIKKAVGIPLTYRCHDLRHQFATILASSGRVDPYTVQRLLTHKDFRTTQRYAHLYEQAMRNGVKVIDEMFSDKAAEKLVEGVDIKPDVA